MDPFDLNWRHLQALPLIGSRGGVSAAAQDVHLSQPALTKGLAKLERSLGAALFDRRPDGLESTEEGRTMIGRVERAADLLGAAVAAVAPRSGYRGSAQLMTRTQMRALLAIADAGSFVGARIAVGLSEPALHRALRDLEQVVGATLVERRGRGVQVTSAGRRLARGVRLAAREIAAGMAEVTRDRAALGPVLIGAMPLARARILPLAVAALQREEPSAAVRIVEGSWTELVEPLRDGAVDFMIGALRPEVAPDLVQSRLFADRLVVVGRAAHPLVGRDPDVGALASFPWIVGAPGTPLKAHWEAMFLGRPLPSAPVACGSTVAIRRMLVSTDLLTLLSPDQVEVEVGAGILSVIGAVAGGTREIGIVMRQGWRPAAAQRRLLELLAIEASTGIPEKA